MRVCERKWGRMSRQQFAALGSMILFTLKTKISEPIRNVQVRTSYMVLLCGPSYVLGCLQPMIWLIPSHIQLLHELSQALIYIQLLILDWNLKERGLLTPLNSRAMIRGYDSLDEFLDFLIPYLFLDCNGPSVPHRWVGQWESEQKSSIYCEIQYRIFSCKFCFSAHLYGMSYTAFVPCIWSSWKRDTYISWMQFSRITIG